ncbi:COP9 signalosome complex subunit 3 [Aspergillus wentii]|nr:COP9 signalosome complex subunit 3 [Aspergillus wentii]
MDLDKLVRKWQGMGHQLITPPPTITSHAMRVYRSLARPYLALARAFEEGDFHKLKSEVEIARSVWHVDNNAGLVSQAMGAFHVFTILRLGKTFASIMMVDVTERVICAMTTKEMEAFIASLIMTGPMKATLLHLQHSADPTMIRFLKSTEVSSILQETEMRAQLVQTRY